MSDKILWGAVFLLYMVPAGIFLFWYLAGESDFEIRKKLYPGRIEILDEEKRRESRTTKLGIGWCIGLGILLTAYKGEWNPIGTGILLLGVPLSIWAIYFGVRYFNLLTNRLFRFWLAGSVVWILAVWSWYVVFGNHSELSGEEFLLLALMPTVVSAVGIVAWSWARKS